MEIWERFTDQTLFKQTEVMLNLAPEIFPIIQITS